MRSGPQAPWDPGGESPSGRSKSYDVVYTEDWTGSEGRLQHIAFATDTREDILRAADLAIDSGVFIETGNADIGFTMYACAALFGAVMMILAALTIKTRSTAKL